jgi:acyl-coenzyme A synthetase/AMP-(fatty) acid ligase/acyl carrier protein
MFSSYAVGQGLIVIFSALLYGATVCMFDARTHGFDRLVNWLAAERITIFISSATLFRSLMRSEGSRLTCPELRLVRLGGESVIVEDVQACRSYLPRHVQFVVGYGATEAAIMTMHAVGADEEFPSGFVPVGRALPGLRVSIAGEDGNPVPHGESGEIVVHGRDLPSYWRESARTEGRYRESPDVPGERCYFTGDRGRARADGCIEHLGRVDRRVKVRGFRVELDEVEQVLGQHPLVVRSAVVAHRNQLDDLTIVGYVETIDPSMLRVDDLRRFMADRLADYKVPSTFIALDRMPLGDARKILRSRLPAPETVRPLADAPVAGPETDLQRVIEAIWLEVLGLTAVSIDDVFFMMGGDSLRAAQVGSRLSEALGIEVSMSLLLQAPTIRQLSERLGAQVAGKDASQAGAGARP